jgi:tetratricopeptide (TPR) repeat protein
MRLTLLAAALALPSIAFAAGEERSVPKPTQTSKECKGVRVWDEQKQRCVRPKKSSLNQDGLYGAVRELAYAGRVEDAQGVLAAMTDQEDDRVLTYWGFTHRKLGNRDLANTYYTRAIARNPDNLLARSYMGQGFVKEGKTDLAIAQWKEIMARGGEGSWPETSLRLALEQGLTFDY